MLFSRRADAATLDAFVARASAESLSYPEVGGSLTTHPSGYHHDEDARTLGHGDAVFARAVAGLTQWQAHRAARIRVHPGDAPIVDGTTVGLALPVAGIRILAACRIVAVIDEPSRFGFAYGTLRSHPEQGEEAFVVANDHDAVTFRITAFSRPSDPVARVTGPLTRWIQRRVTNTYLDGLADYVERSA